MLDLADELLYKEQSGWWDNVRLLAARREDMTEVTGDERGKRQDKRRKKNKRRGAGYMAMPVTEHLCPFQMQYDSR